MSSRKIGRGVKMALAMRRRERGAVAVEMAIVLPLLVLLLGGIIDFGRAFVAQIVLTNAAREGVRAAVVRVDLTEIRLRAQVASAGIPSSTWQVPAVSVLMPGGSVVVDPADGCGGSPTPVSVTVTTSATFDYIFLGVVPGIEDPTVLSSTAVMECS